VRVGSFGNANPVDEPSGFDFKTVHIHIKKAKHFSSRWADPSLQTVRIGSRITYYDVRKGSKRWSPGASSAGQDGRKTAGGVPATMDE
jgi:hypothetical protein